MLRICLFLSIFFIFAFAEDVSINSVDDILKYAPKKSSQTNNKRIPVKLSNDELQEKTNFSLDDLSALAPTNEVELSDNKFYDEVRVKKLTLKVTNPPKIVYAGEIFKVEFKADIGQDLLVEQNLTISHNENIKWLNQNSINWIKGNGIFETPLWFEAQNGAKINEIKMTLTRNGEFFSEANVNVKLPEIKPLPKKANFAHIVANDLIVKSYKSSKFDDDTNLMTLNLIVKNANLSSFYIDNKAIIKQGVDSAYGDYSSQSGFYFAVIDNKIKSLDFSYFNLKTKKFENFVLDISVTPEDLSTQTGLNPQESKFKLYKNIAIYGFVGLLLVMFVASKNITPLIFAAVILIANFLLQKPYGSEILEKNVAVKILPTQNSTIFHITKNSEKVEILDKNSEYYKILLDSGKIGWVKKGDLKRE